MISYKQWSIIPTLACTSVLNSYNVFRTWCDQDCVKIFFFRDQSGRAKNQGEQCSLQTEGLSLAETDPCNTLPCPPGIIWRTIALHCIASKNDRRNSRGTLWQKETWLTLFVHQSASISISINLHQSASITINQYQSISASIRIKLAFFWEK